LIRTVRRFDDARREILAIAVTTLSEREDRREFQRAGFDACLAKPVKPNQVVALLTTLLARLEPEKPPLRRLLVLVDEREHAAAALAALRVEGHEILEFADPKAAFRAAIQLRPNAILLVEPVRDASTSRLADRFASLKDRPPLIGLIDSGAEPVSPVSDFLVPTHNPGALRRVLRLLEEPLHERT